MPFDGITPASSPEIEMLDQMAAALATPQQWTKDLLHAGKPRSLFSLKIGSHCINGALNILDHGYAGYSFGTSADVVMKTPAGRNIGRAFTQIIAERHYDTSRWKIYGSEHDGVHVSLIAAFNNAPTTTHADILNLIAKARAHFVAMTIPDRELVLA